VRTTQDPALTSVILFAKKLEADVASRFPLKDIPPPVLLATALDPRFKSLSVFSAPALQQYGTFPLLCLVSVSNSVGKDDLAKIAEQLLTQEFEKELKAFKPQV
jgi:hypothetical protein